MPSKKTNFLVIIADDHSWPHTGYYGCNFVNTPSLDRIANEGVIFENAYCSAPQCTPARASLLTGLNMWRLEEGSILGGFLPRKFKTYTEILEKKGYHVGYTGKGWGPGSIEAAGRKQNPSGKCYNDIKLTPPSDDISCVDYDANFKKFMSDKIDDTPFCFWLGAFEPHRPYKYGSGLANGGKLEDVVVPPYLPDCEETRMDLLDYAYEISWYDNHVGKVLDYLEEIGELDNTLIMATGDNGMPFPRAKDNLYVNSCQVPFAIRWGDMCKGGRRVTDFLSFTDIAPTIFEAAGIETEIDFSGRSLLPTITSSESGRIDETRNRVYAGKEYHVQCRKDRVGYPTRSVRTDKYLFIKNYEPDRWPVGTPESGFADTDWSPTRQYMVDNKEEEMVREPYRLCFEKRPMYELYDLENDPYCLKNTAGDEANKAIVQEMCDDLESLLQAELDPRVLGWGEIYDSYPDFQGPYTWSHTVEGWFEKGEYNQHFINVANRNSKASLSNGIEKDK